MGLHKYIQLSILEIDDPGEHSTACACVKELIREMFDEDMEDVSWWAQDEEMKLLSLFFHGYTFELDIDQGGTEYYKDYYRDGLHKHCQGEIVYEDPNDKPWES